MRATIAPSTQIERHIRLKNSGGYQAGECSVLGGPLKPSGVLRVLVVDDQRTMRQMVTMLFQQLAVKITSQTSICLLANILLQLAGASRSGASTELYPELPRKANEQKCGLIASP